MNRPAVTAFGRALFVFLWAAAGIVACDSSDVSGPNGSSSEPLEIYSPTAESLNTHPLPAWFQDAKFGIFIHWGPYSVPAYGNVSLGVPFSYSEWYWFFQMYGFLDDYHLKNFGPDVAYDDFIGMWKAEQFDARQLVDLIQRSGARYAVLVSKHHDGVALWNSHVTGRNTVHLGPGRDFVQEYVDAMRDAGLKAGLYYSLFEWFHPAYPADDGYFNITAGLKVPKLDLINRYTKQPLDYSGYTIEVSDYVDEHMLPQIRELIDNYDPDLLWFDGQWDLPGSYWRLPEVVADYFNKAANRDDPKEVLVNDRFGDGMGWNGDFATFEYRLQDDISPEIWEATRGIGESFGYNAAETISHYLTADEVVDMLVDVVSKNGNLLLNIGPKADGSVIDTMSNTLLDVGRWLDTNGEAIFASRPWERYGEGSLRFTRRENVTYIISLERPESELRANIPVTAGSTITLLGFDTPLTYTTENTAVIIQLPEPTSLPGEYAWTFRIAPPAQPE